MLSETQFKEHTHDAELQDWELTAETGKVFLSLVLLKSVCFNPIRKGMNRHIGIHKKATLFLRRHCWDASSAHMLPHMLLPRLQRQAPDYRRVLPSLYLIKGLYIQNFF